MNIHNLLLRDTSLNLEILVASSVLGPSGSEHQGKITALSVVQGIFLSVNKAEASFSTKKRR